MAHPSVALVQSPSVMCIVFWVHDTRLHRSKRLFSSRRSAASNFTRAVHCDKLPEAREDDIRPMHGEAMQKELQQTYPID